MKEEIFGPILPLLTFEHIDEIVEIIRKNPDPLSMYIFSETIMHLSNEKLPFGGRGSSGHGSYHGKYTYETFTHMKSVFKGRETGVVGLLMKIKKYVVK